MRVRVTGFDCLFFWAELRVGVHVVGDFCLYKAALKPWCERFDKVLKNAAYRMIRRIIYKL